MHAYCKYFFNKNDIGQIIISRQDYESINKIDSVASICGIRVEPVKSEAKQYLGSSFIYTGLADSREHNTPEKLATELDDILKAYVTADVLKEIMATGSYVTDFIKLQISPAMAAEDSEVATTVQFDANNNPLLFFKTDETTGNTGVHSGPAPFEPEEQLFSPR